MEAGTLSGGPHAQSMAGAHGTPRTGISKWLFTTDHKLIGVMYVWLGFFFFAAFLAPARPPAPPSTGSP